MKLNPSSPKPGVYAGVSEPDYRAVDAVSQSELKEFLAAPTPLHYQTRKPKEATADMEFGTVCHAAILQPEKFAEAYYLRPETYPTKDGDKPWHGGAAWCKEWLLSHADRPVMTKDDIERVGKIRANVSRLPIFGEALENGQTEVAFIRVDVFTGLPTKCRVDLVAADNAGELWIFDLKKVQRGHADHASFSKSCADYGYDIQAAAYLSITGAKKFIFVPFDDDAPFDCCLFEPDADMLRIGLEKWKYGLEKYQRCKSVDQWPGYPKEIQPLSLPKWAKS